MRCNWKFFTFKSVPVHRRDVSISIILIKMGCGFQLKIFKNTFNQDYFETSVKSGMCQIVSSFAAKCIVWHNFE